MLPVSGLTLHVREATGADELVVLEPGRLPAVTLVTLASRLAADAQGQAPVWEELPAADAAAIALTLRQAWLGDRIRTDARCPNAGCLERMDIAFEISAYLAHHRPEPCPGVTPASSPGWYNLPNAAAGPSAGAAAGAPVSFRLPTIGDLLASLASPDPEQYLRERCVRPANVSAAVADRVSEAMGALAPSVGGIVTMRCPACGGSADLSFDPVTYSLTELRAAAAGLYEEVHLLASAFHWPEDAILALPRSRRVRYAELIRKDRAAA